MSTGESSQEAPRNTQIGWHVVVSKDRLAVLAVAVKAEAQDLHGDLHEALHGALHVEEEEVVPGNVVCLLVTSKMKASLRSTLLEFREAPLLMNWKSCLSLVAR